MADFKDKILPLPPYLRFLLNVPSVANAEITSQETLMATGNKDKEDKKKVKESGDTKLGPTPEPEPPRHPTTGLPFDILGELYDIAKEIEKKSETPKTTEIKVEEKKPYIVSYTVSGKPITDIDLQKEMSQLSTEELNKQRRDYFNAFNNPTSTFSPQRWKNALSNVKEMPQDLTPRDLISKKWNNKLDMNTRRMYLAHARLDAINEELSNREAYNPKALEQSEFDIMYDTEEENKKRDDLKERLASSIELLNYYETRNMDQEANKMKETINSLTKLIKLAKR